MKSLLPLSALLLSCTSGLLAQLPPPASAIFDKDAVHEIRIRFRQADWYQQLTRTYDQFPDDTPYLEGSLTWGEYKFDSIGVRFKGNSSYRGATTRKKPFRIKLNEFVKGQKIEAMASFGLSNAWNDPSFVREKAYFEMAKVSGLGAPRSSFAALYVNDEYMGLYVLGEIVNGDFLKAHFANKDDTGNLYKASDPGANLAYLGTSPSAYQRFFSKESNEDANDWSDLIELARIFDQTPAAELPAKLENLVDVDSFLTALALDNITVNLDSYVGMAQNYYLYRRPSDQKWVWIPWDPSLSFGAHSQGLSAQQMRDLPLEWVVPAGGGFPGGAPGGGPNQPSNTRPVASKLWAVPQYKERYRQIYKAIAEGVMIPSEVAARMESLRALIRPWVERDTQKLVTQAQFDNAMTADGAASPAGAAPALRPLLEARAVAVKEQLAGRQPVLFSAVPLLLGFAQVQSASGAAAQTFSITAPIASTWSVTASAPWITVSSASGSLPASLRIGVTPGSMAPGIYNGSLRVEVAGTTNSPLNIPVTMAITNGPAIVTSPASLTFNGGGPGGPGQPGAPQGNALTQTITALSTAGSSPISVSVSGSTCGNFVTVSPITGTTPAPLNVTVNGNGLAGSCTARITVASSGLVSAEVPVTFAPIQNPGGPGGIPGTAPVVNGVVNGASYSRGPVAPGEIITIFGINLGPRTGANGIFNNGLLGTNTGGVQVMFDGIAAPVVYAGFDQVSAVVPFELAGRTQTNVSVLTNGRGSLPVVVGLSPTAPGLFTTRSTGTGQGTIFNQNGAANGGNAAAQKGSTVSIYLTGGGALNPAGRSGALGGPNQILVAPVAVSIGGANATVVTAGAIPGTLQAVSRIDVVVPQGAASGPAVPLQVTVDGVQAQPGVTIAIQ